MGLDLWFREDVARILASTQETMRSSLGAVPPLDPEAAAAYRQGFGDALGAVAVAFGLVSGTQFEQGHPSPVVRIVDAGGTSFGANGMGPG